MIATSITFDTNVSTELPKYIANPNQTARAAVLHFVDDKNQLQAIIRMAQTHYHQVPEGQMGLGGFFCLSAEDSVAPCCKNTGIFQEPVIRIAIPIILYPTTFQGDLIPGATPEIQVLLVYEKGWNKLKSINKTYPLATNDFTITGKKQGKGVALDFMPAGPAYWQQETAMFSQFLSKAKVLVEGPGLTSLDRMLGRKLGLAEVENAIRAANGQPALIPAPPMVPPIPLMPMGSVASVQHSYPTAPPIPPPPATFLAAPAPQIPQPMAPPIPQPMAPPIPQPMAPPQPQGPASPAQISAISNIASMLAPQIPIQPDGE